MAASISMSSVSGYPTKDAMAVKVNFTVQYPGDYYARFDVYNYRTDKLYDTYYGSTYTMAANCLHWIEHHMLKYLVMAYICTRMVIGIQK